MKRSVSTFALLGTLAASAFYTPSAQADTLICTGYSGCETHGYNSAQSYWGAYPGHNCTNYVSFMLARNGVRQPGSPMGNAAEWNRWRTPDDRPAVGSIAWWSGGSIMGSAGHVAYVEKVSSDGRTITVSEDSWGGDFHWRTIDRGSARWPSGFLHFKDVAPPGSWNGVGGASFIGTDTLTPGKGLRRGQYMTSQNVQYALVFQGDGNLVLYHGKSSVWASDTANKRGDRVVMQGDGNLVMYRGGTAVWATDTEGNGASRFVLQDDGNLVVRRNDGRAVWASGTDRNTLYRAFGSDRLRAGQSLRSDHYLRSGDKRYALHLQSDGNIVLYGPGYHVLWTSRTAGKRTERLVMQGDGNLVAYRGGTPVWASNTDGEGNSSLILQNDGNLVVRRADGRATWASGTDGRI